ncbi:M56 family metallopeptidase [Novosphingobium album (ex Liu et al. 2023)]|uniref:M56 family metallopeptidase n=1 Tax=Novosphingobium album (ex Liu et al. 2023) TaxID=3031130 RepID=A0ABT5WLB2_9SPHN|nr:M56 family metallopeptidase [Novosphingobium album (ex Liu et al. 2023)]MDE8650097.1 M56 family metallopeptidase [Novosphingobium album (ex Liu et al. 2023)]
MIEWLIDTLVMTGALMALVLLVRRPVGRWFGPAAAYALWALPMIRLFLPPLVLPEETVARPEFALSPLLAQAAPARPAAAIADAVPVAVVAEPASAPAAPLLGQLAALPWGEILLAVWLGGAVVFLLARTIGYRAMRRELLRDARHVGRAGRVRIVESPAVAAPVAFGVLDKVVALPAGFLATADSDASDFAVTHELQHHAGNDLAANIAVQPLFALHWFNPVAWLAWRALRSDQEAACDARVMNGCGRAERERYGRLIASFAAGPRLALAAPMAGPLSGDKPIIHRLKALVRNDVSERRRLLGRSLFAAAVIGVPLTATITYAATEADPTADLPAPAAPREPEMPEAPLAPEAPPAPEPPLPGTTARIVHREFTSDCTEKVVTQDGRTTRTKDCPEGQDRKTYRRVVQHEGKTFEFVTDRPLSDDEIDARIERDMARAEAQADRAERDAERRAAEAERRAERIAADAERRTADAERLRERAWTMAPEVEESTSRDGKVQTIRIAGRDANGNRSVARTMVIDSTCPAGGSSSRTAWAGQGPAASATQMRICTGAPDVSHQIIPALQKARASIASNRSLPPEVRSDIVAQLDGQIAEARAEAR